MKQVLYSETFGRGADVLLVHGWGMHGGVWGEFAQLLARNYRVTALDLPGHGYSPLLGEGWVESVLQAAPAHAHWLGWSMGAQIALQAAATHPDRVRCLLMLSGTPCFVTHPDWPTAMERESFEAFHRLVVSEGAGALPRFLALQAQGLAQARSLWKQMHVLLEQRPLPASQALLAGLDFLRATDLRTELSGLNRPVYALLGARDALVPAAVGDALRQLNPSVRLAVLADAAHQPFLSHPSECADLVTKYLFDHAAG